MNAWLSRFVGWSMRQHLVVLGAAVALLSMFGLRTALTYGSLKSDLEELLPKSAPSVTAIGELRARLPGIRFLGVVLETESAAGTAAASAFLERLAERAQAYPRDLAAGVRLGTASERRFAETYALQLMEPADVRRLREAVEARRDFEVGRSLGTGLEEEAEPPPLPLDELRRKYETSFGVDAGRGERFISPDGKSLALLVQTSSQSTAYEQDARLFERVRSDVAALGGPPPGTRLGYAGDVATRVEETRGLATDLTVSSVVVLTLVLSALVWFFRSWAALVALFVPLALGTTAAFALVALPPLSIQSLNSNTAFLGSIVIGNGINSGIMLLARLQEELERRVALADAVRIAISETWRATLAAALAAAAAYGSLLFTDFRGFNQFGWIGSLGIVLCWAAVYVTLPALAQLLGERLRPRRRFAPRRERRTLSQRVIDFTLHHRRVVLALIALLGIGALSGLAMRRGDWIEYDLSKLRRQDSWQSGEPYWAQRLDAATGRYLTPTVVMASDAQAVPHIEQRSSSAEARAA